MENTTGHKKANLYKIIEQVAVVIGAFNCLVVVSLFAFQQMGDLWPFPGFYFIEVSLLAILSAASRLFKVTAGKIIWIVMPWITAGVLLPLVILGGFSIGPFLFPALLVFLLSGILTDLRLGQRMGTHISLAVMAALIQWAIIIGANMLAVSPR